MIKKENESIEKNIFYRNENALKKFSEKGIPVAETPYQLSESSDVIITMLPSSSHVRCFLNIFILPHNHFLTCQFKAVTYPIILVQRTWPACWDVVLVSFLFLLVKVGDPPISTEIKSQKQNTYQTAGTNCQFFQIDPNETRNYSSFTTNVKVPYWF